MTIKTATAGKQRIKNLPAGKWTPEVEALFPIMLPAELTTKGSDFNSILILANHPQLAEPWLRFNAKVAQGFTLSSRLKEIVILRAAWRQGSDYEWVHHMISAARVGLTSADFDALQSDLPGSGWSDPEAELIRAIDQICLDGRIAPPTLTALNRHFSVEQVMELLFVATCYVALATVLNTAGAVIEPPVLEMAASAGFPMLKPVNRPKLEEQE